MLETNRGNPENDAHECSNHSGCRNRKIERKPYSGCKNGSRIGPYPEKGPVAKGNLTSISNEEIEPNGSNRCNSDVVDHIQDIMTANGRDNDKKEEKPDPHPQPAKICPEDCELVFVSFIKLSTGM
jgi:hypothetical protein